MINPLYKRPTAYQTLDGVNWHTLIQQLNALIEVQDTYVKKDSKTYDLLMGLENFLSSLIAAKEMEESIRKEPDTKTNLNTFAGAYDQNKIKE